MPMARWRLARYGRCRAEIRHQTLARQERGTPVAVLGSNPSLALEQKALERRVLRPAGRLAGKGSDHRVIPSSSIKAPQTPPPKVYNQVISLAFKFMHAFGRWPECVY